MTVLNYLNISTVDELLNIDNPYFDQMVGQIYSTKLQLNKVNSYNTEAPFVDLDMSITNGILSSKTYDKREDLNYEIVNFSFSIPRLFLWDIYFAAYAFCESMFLC